VCVLTSFCQIATSWNGWGTSLGTCSVHSWNDGLDEDEGLPPMGMKYKAKLEPDEEAVDPTGWWGATRTRTRTLNRQ
jgi:WD repeat-containing protein 23